MTSLMWIAGIVAVILLIVLATGLSKAKHQESVPPEAPSPDDDDDSGCCGNCKCE